MKRSDNRRKPWSLLTQEQKERKIGQALRRIENGETLRKITKTNYAFLFRGLIYYAPVSFKRALLVRAVVAHLRNLRNSDERARIRLSAVEFRRALERYDSRLRLSERGRELRGICKHCGGAFVLSLEVGRCYDCGIEQAPGVEFLRDQLMP